jgi:hypothetical protein
VRVSHARLATFSALFFSSFSTLIRSQPRRGAHCEHVVLALKSILQPVLTRGQAAEVLPDVQQLLTSVHMLPLGLQQDSGRAVEALLELANTGA